MGVDGWKTDASDPFILEYVIPWGKKGFYSYRDYANSYYTDFFEYSRKIRGKDSLIMSRPCDSEPF